MRFWVIRSGWPIIEFIFQAGWCPFFLFFGYCVLWADFRAWCRRFPGWFVALFYRLLSGSDWLFVCPLCFTGGVCLRFGWRGRGWRPVRCCPCGRVCAGFFSNPCVRGYLWRLSLRTGPDSRNFERWRSQWGQ